MVRCLQTKEILQEQLPRRGNIIVENKANKENTPELLVLISVTTVSSGASNRSKFREQWQKEGL